MSQREFSPSSPAIANAPERSAVARERFLATGQAPAVFRSVLDPSSEREEPAEPAEAPAFFRDLNLDQIVASIIIGKQEYNLAPFFYRPLKTVEAVEYRQEVMRDLQDHARSDAINRIRHRDARGSRPCRPGGETLLQTPEAGLVARRHRALLQGRRSNCFPDCAPRCPDRPASPASSLISTPMSRRRRFKS